MKRLVTLVIVLSVCVGSTVFAQTDDQSNKKKKRKAQTTAQTAATPAPSKTQTKNRTYSKPVHSNTGNYNQNRQNVRVEKSKKYKNQTNVVNNNNAKRNKTNVTKKEWRHFKRTGNELSFSDARRWNWRQHHERVWWERNNYRLVRYGGGYWYWNAGWWYPAYGYDPYYSHYVYDGPIFGYGQAFPGDVTSEVQRALADQGYYHGPIDGILGPGTRAAIQRYQISRGLAVTATIDEQTLATLGLT